MKKILMGFVLSNAAFFSGASLAGGIAPDGTDVVFANSVPNGLSLLSSKEMTHTKGAGGWTRCLKQDTNWISTSPGLKKEDNNAIHKVETQTWIRDCSGQTMQQGQ